MDSFIEMWKKSQLPVWLRLTTVKKGKTEIGETVSDTVQKYNTLFNLNRPFI